MPDKPFPRVALPDNTLLLSPGDQRAIVHAEMRLQAELAQRTAVLGWLLAQHGDRVVIPRAALKELLHEPGRWALELTDTADGVEMRVHDQTKP